MNIESAQYGAAKRFYSYCTDLQNFIKARVIAATVPLQVNYYHATRPRLS